MKGGLLGGHKFCAARGVWKSWTYVFMCNIMRGSTLYVYIYIASKFLPTTQVNYNYISS